MTDCIQQTLATDARTPGSTYRLQMHENFTFEDAQAILPYLKKLGIGDVYLSPIFEARPHSMHGYDVTRHDCLNPELGGEAKFKPFAAALREHGMGLLLDTVPNHMGVGNKSVWWQDVLENGRASEYSGYFDIDWEPLKPDMQNKLLLPILGCQYGEALEAKQLQVRFEDGRALIAYFDHLQPIAPRTLPMVFPSERDAEFGVPAEFRALLDELCALPPHESTDPQLTHERRERLEQLKPRLEKALCANALQPVLKKAAAAINGTEGDARSFDALHALLEEQPYRLAFWRTSSEQINYRRFFDVNDLVGLRMENPEVFAETHSLIRRLLAEGDVTGLRIDHCDGMFNPHVYLERLQQMFVAARCLGAAMDPNDAHEASGIERSVLDATRGRDWTDAKLPLYCVVEKILEPGETLPRTWAVQGTSGYDFVHFANQFFIQSKNRSRFNAIYSDFIGGGINPMQIVYEAKRNVMLSSLSSETHVLANLLSHLARSDRRVRDFTDNLLETVIRETIACFPIYRTYIDERGQYSEEDKKTIRTAIRTAKRRNASVDASAFDYLQQMLLLEGRGARGDAQHDEAQLYFALKFQQLTGPVMAKGVEDTSFYVYFRFISSNEVGSAMDAFGLKPETLHRANAERLKHTPHALLTTSTHDTKRSEDVRNRLNVLSEMPDAWAAQVEHWAEANAVCKTTLDDDTVAPDANEEYLIYQTIVGAWPWLEVDQKNFAGRVKEYMAKALSEGKVNVSWINPRPEYTEAVQRFVDRLLVPAAGKTRFVEELESMLAPVKVHGAVNSLAQMVLKATSPGVPDFYQGTDMWDLSLVDPDNRRPVDYPHRSRILEAFATTPVTETIPDLLRTLDDGRVKLFAMQRTLAVRNAHRAVFDSGAYTPLEVSNPEHAFAYLRGDDALVILPCFTYTLTGGKAEIPLGEQWAGMHVALPEGAPATWLNAFTGKEISSANSALELEEVFADFPVAILTRKP